MKKLAALLFCLIALPALADDNTRANSLLVEAVQFIQAAEDETTAQKKLDLLKQAHGNLQTIMDDYPSTDLAVRLITGQQIGIFRWRVSSRRLRRRKRRLRGRKRRLRRRKRRLRGRKRRLRRRKGRYVGSPRRTHVSCRSLSSRQIRLNMLVSVHWRLT